MKAVDTGLFGLLAGMQLLDQGKHRLWARGHYGCFLLPEPGVRCRIHNFCQVRNLKQNLEMRKLKKGRGQSRIRGIQFAVEDTSKQ